MKKQPLTIVFALLFTIVVPSIGYLSFDIWIALLFLTGYLAGFILWMTVPIKVPFASVIIPYWVTFGVFLLHIVEENVFGFQQELSKLTGVSVLEVTSFSIIFLLLASVGAWLLAPFLAQRGYGFGYFLVWTFFVWMGITEFVQFIFPYLRPGRTEYFPGMASALFLATTAWYGIWRLSHTDDQYYLLT